MKNRMASIAFIFFVLIVFFIIVIQMIKSTRREEQERKTYVENVYGQIMFQGKIVNTHRIARDGRVYGIVCVLLDNSNVKNFYRYDKWTCFQIKDNMATFPIDFLGDSTNDVSVQGLLSAKYIKVNINGNRKAVFLDSANQIVSIQELYYGNNNLRKSDMDICN